MCGMVVQVGAGWVEGVDVGPMISRDAKTRAEGLVQDSYDAGVDILLDGRYLTHLTVPEVPGRYRKGGRGIES